MDKEKAMREFKQYEKMRQEMYDFLDRSIPKKEDGTMDFENARPIHAKELFDRWFKLDYQARKIRGIAMKCLEESGE